MKAVILAGGLGTRISEETHLKPKPMVEIGGMPILWHLMKFFSFYNINDFIICCGYKGYVIKDYFSNYFSYMSDMTIDMSDHSIKYHNKNTEPWKVTLIDTGEKTMTGGRLKRISGYIEDEKDFLFTYGDGLADVNLDNLVKHHRKQNTLATVTAVRPAGRYGALKIKENLVHDFIEKPEGDGGLINGGFFVLKPEVINYIKDDSIAWEEEPLEKLSSENQLSFYEHKGFWQPMDTLREKNLLENLWQDKPPWKIWK